MDEINHDLIFPENFLWGTATSAHQVEGDNFNNDWWYWEHSRKRIEGLKKEDKNPKDFISEKACDQYHLYEKDFDLIKSLNNNAYRFSIEWSRIEPEEGKFAEEEIQHYRKLLSALKARGVIPFVTLQHFTLPLWLFKKGGALSKEVAEYFERYVKFVVEELGDLVEFWITVNEPVIGAVGGFLWETGPPQGKSLFKTIKVIRNSLKSHKKAYQAIHQIQKEAKVGVAKNNIYFEPYNSASFLDKFSTILLDYFWNRYFLNKTKKYLDFIGLNYYFPSKVKFPLKTKSSNRVVSDTGSEIYPKGIYYVLKELQKYKKPIYVTENGLADTQDKLRAEFIIDHLRWIHKAIQEGMDIQGYFHWSLLDNFEWAEGFLPKFGLFEVNYKTLERIARKSVEIYSEICKNNGIPKEFLERYL